MPRAAALTVLFWQRVAGFKSLGVGDAARGCGELDDYWMKDMVSNPSVWEMPRAAGGIWPTIAGTPVVSIPSVWEMPRTARN